VQAQHTSWLMYEYTTLERLHTAGAAVPQPLAASENAILMGYRGDALRGAPTLSEVGLEGEEAHALFAEAMRNLELMLRLDVIHGDLSAYNMLYWEGRITIIDFPQVSAAASNSQARFILQRDITRTCEYFQRQGIPCDPTAILEDLWERYAASRVQPLPDLPEKNEG
jgi:RIO kinase 1